MADSMMALAKALRNGDSEPLNEGDKDLLRISTVPYIKELMNGILTAHLRGDYGTVKAYTTLMRECGEF